MVDVPSSVVSSSVLTETKRGSSGGTERAFALHISSCSELCLVLSKVRMRCIDIRVHTIFPRFLI
jgi:hypothetical protein